MKKILIVAAAMVFGFSSQALAASVSGQSQQKNNPVETVPMTGNAVETNEQNAVKNQGENTQIQTQEQNTVQAQDGEASKKKGSDGKSSDLSGQRRSQVANAVQAMLQIAERNGGIGQQVRTIAQNQNQNQMKLEQDIEKIQSRGGLAKFFLGAKYGEVKDAQKILEQNKEQIKQLNQVRTQLSNQGDQQQLAEQIKLLEGTDQEIEALLADAQSGFSLFGWLNKLVS